MFIGDYFDTDHQISGISTIYIDATNNPSWEFPLHTHKNAVELSLIESGEANVYCSGRMYHAKYGGHSGRFSEEICLDAL